MFKDVIADMESNTKLSPKVTELLLRGRKLNISLVFIAQSNFKWSKTIRLNAIHYLIMKIPNKRKLQQIASKHASDINFKDFMKLYKIILKNYIHFSERFRKNIIKMSINEKTKVIKNKIEQNKT